jgi:hypothetical protein
LALINNYASGITIRRKIARAHVFRKKDSMKIFVES